MADQATIAMFNTALDRIEKVARVAPKEGDDLATAFVYSGGHFQGDKPQQQIPAIYLSPEPAVDDWCDHILAFLAIEQAATFRFAEIPKLEKLIMTETGEDGAQRLTATRYGVTSKMAVLSRLEPATLAAAPSRKSKPKPRKKAAKAKPARRRKRR